MNYVKEFEKDCRIRGLTKQTILTYRSNISDYLAATQNLKMYLAWRERNYILNSCESLREAAGHTKTMQVV